MSRVQLPKAYLRIDPNIDQTHPDNLDAFIRLLCAGNRQPTRGQFRTRQSLDTLFGKRMTDQFFRRGDVAVQDDGSISIPHWDLWQEGDLDVAERMRRLRHRRANGGSDAA